MLENTKKQMEMVKRGEIPRGWKEVQLKDIAVIIETKNTINNSNVLTISAQYGLISQKDFLKKKSQVKTKKIIIYCKEMILRIIKAIRVVIYMVR